MSLFCKICHLYCCLFVRSALQLESDFIWVFKDALANVWRIKDSDVEKMCCRLPGCISRAWQQSFSSFSLISVWLCCFKMDDGFCFSVRLIVFYIDSLEVRSELSEVHRSGYQDGIMFTSRWSCETDIVPPCGKTTQSLLTQTVLKTVFDIILSMQPMTESREHSWIINGCNEMFFFTSSSSICHSA